VDGAAAAERQFVWGPNYVDELVLRDRDADANSGNGLEERLYAVHDGLYSVTALVNSAGAVQERFAYTPYGESTVLDANFATDSDGSSDFAWETRFTGREFDAESGLYHYRNRFYHAQAGLFISRDPWSYVDGSNLYAAYFVPLFTDPFGTILTSSDEAVRACRRLPPGPQRVACFKRLLELLEQSGGGKRAHLEECRSEVDTEDDSYEKCKQKCHDDYDMDAEICRKPGSARTKALCWERVAEKRANCIKRCNELHKDAKW